MPKRKNLKKWHIDNNLSYKDVYETLGYSKNHYSLILNGKADPSFGFIEAFGNTYNHLIDDIWELFKKE